MKETIIYSNYFNQAEFLRMCAKFNVPLFNTRVMNQSELVDSILTRSSFDIKDYFDTESLTVNILAALNQDELVKFFGKPSYDNASNIVKTIYNLLFLNIDENDIFEYLKDSKFALKNSILYSLISFTTDYLKNNGYYDKYSLINKAINDSTYKFDEIIVFNEFSITKLEEKLLKKISNNLVRINIKDFLNLTNRGKNVYYSSSRGKTNEVLNALKIVRDNNIPFDECLFVTLDSKYDDIIDNYSNLYNFKYTNANGYNIKRSNPAKLLSAYLDYSNYSFNREKLYSLVFNEAFDKTKLFDTLGNKEIKFILNQCSSLKLTYSLDDNLSHLNGYLSVLDDSLYNEIISNKGIYNLDIESYKKYIKNIFNDFGLSKKQFINKYTIIRNNKIDALSLNRLNNTFDILNDLNNAIHYNFDEELLNRYYSLKIANEVSLPGYIHVTNLNEAFSSLRKNVFIFGLSSSIFPGEVKEDYLFLDNEYFELTKDKDCINISENIVKDKSNKLLKLIDLSLSNNSNIYLSYSSFEIKDVKANNPSSLLSQIYLTLNKDKSIKDFNVCIENNSNDNYFFSEFNNYDHLLKQIISGKKIINDEETDIEESEDIEDETIGFDSRILLNRKYSPSAIESFNKCITKFIYEKILYLEKNEEDDLFNIIPANDFGTLAHSLMEELKENKMSLNEFVLNANKKFDDYLLRRVPYNDSVSEAVKKDFIKMMENEYSLMKDNEIIEVEKKVYFEHAYNDDVLKIEGRLDALCKDKDGKYFICDYKTGNSIKHENNDVNTCLQALIYAYIIENTTDIKIDRVEYHYPKFKTIVSCPYNEDIKLKVMDKLNIFISDLLNILYVSDNNTDCTYCGYKDICFLWRK